MEKRWKKTSLKARDKPFFQIFAKEIKISTSIDLKLVRLNSKK
jgi:hypothetical protein